MTVEQLARGNEIRSQVAALDPASDVLEILDGWMEGVVLGNAVLVDGEVDGEFEQILALAEHALVAEAP